MRLTFPGDANRDVLLEGCPRAGDTIRLDNGGMAPVLVVEHVLWREVALDAEPNVIVAVRPRPTVP